MEATAHVSRMEGKVGPLECHLARAPTNPVPATALTPVPNPVPTTAPTPATTPVPNPVPNPVLATAPTHAPNRAPTNPCRRLRRCPCRTPCLTRADARADDCADPRTDARADPCATPNPDSLSRGRARVFPPSPLAPMRTRGSAFSWRCCGLYKQRTPDQQRMPHAAQNTKTPQARCGFQYSTCPPPHRKCVEFRLRRAARVDVEHDHSPNAWDLAAWPGIPGPLRPQNS